MSSFPDDFCPAAPGSPFAPSLAPPVARFLRVAGECEAIAGHVLSLLDEVVRGDTDQITDFDTDRLRLVLGALKNAKQAMQIVERNINV